MRVVAQLSLGVGALALMGGAVMVCVFVLGNIGAATSIFGQNSLQRIGVAALIGFVIAWSLPRLGVPLLLCVGMSATIGAGTTAQLGAMRIGEEIDALEVLGINTITYLASTRVIAGIIVAAPLGCLGQLSGYIVAHFVLTVVSHQSAGGYEHYFNTFLKLTDTFWCLSQVVAQAAVIMLIHTYYGYHASGGPAGVGEATGRSVRAGLVAAIFVGLLVTLGAYGRSGDFRLSG
jgi:phospholipid/cholesterol/gamma-HCH transport system permease protein